MTDSTPKTMLETAIENRNFFQGRLINNMVDVLYFTKQKKTFKRDSQERVNAMNAIVAAEKNITETKDLLECFDQLITSLGGAL